MASLEEFQLSIKPHSRAKRMKLRYDAASESAVVTVPLYSSDKEAKKFAEKHLGWLRKQKQSSASRKFLAHGTIIPFRGKDHAIQHDPTRSPTVQISNAEIRVGGIAHGLPKRLENYFKKKAKQEIEPIAVRMAEETGVTFKRIQIRDTKSRWGSCSTTGTLSFSWRLIMTPPEILEYVVAHEIAHLSEMNHSAAFWRIVDELVPNALSSRRWLRTEGHALMLILSE